MKLCKIVDVHPSVRQQVGQFSIQLSEVKRYDVRSALRGVGAIALVCDHTTSPNQPRRTIHFTTSTTGTIVKANAIVSIQSPAERPNVPNAR